MLTLTDVQELTVHFIKLKLTHLSEILPLFKNNTLTQCLSIGVAY